MDERINWRDEALQLPLDDLKKIYESKKRQRTLTTSIPFMLALLILLAANYLTIFGGGFTARVPVWFITSGLFSVAGMFLRFFLGFSYNGSHGSNLVIIVSGADLALQLIFSLLCQNYMYLGFSVVFSAYVILLRPYVLSLDSDIAFLRAMPTFPFNGRVSDQMINIAEHKRKIQLIESAKGNIYSDNAEQIFDKPVPEMPQYEKGDTPEDYLQRKQFYVDGKYTRTSLTDEEYDRQEDELYERRMFTDKQKKQESAIPAPAPIEDDGRLQEFDFTDHSKMNETYIISKDVFTDEFDETPMVEPPKPDDYVVSPDLVIEDMDYPEAAEQTAQQ